MIAALIILGITNITTLVVFAIYIYLENKEKAKTINALISKSSQEFINQELTDKMSSIPKEPPFIPPDYDEESTLDDDEFEDKVVNSERNS